MVDSAQQYAPGGLAMPPNPNQIAAQLGVQGVPNKTPTPPPSAGPSASQLYPKGIEVGGNAPMLPGTGGDTDMDKAANYASSFKKASADQLTEHNKNQGQIDAMKGALSQGMATYQQLPEARRVLAQAQAEADAKSADAIQGERDGIKGVLDAWKKKGETPIDAAPEYKPLSPLEKFGSFGSMLGIFASALTRTPMVNALNASAGAMKAADQGNVAEFNAKYDHWKDQTELAIKRAKEERDDAKDILDLMGKDTSLALAQLKAKAAATPGGWQAASIIANAGDLPEMGHFVESLSKAIDGLDGSKREMAEHRAAQEDKLRDLTIKEKEDKDLHGGGVDASAQSLEDLAKTAGFSPETLKRAAEKYHATGVLPPGLGNKATAIKSAIQNAESLMFPDSNAGEMLSNQAGVKADSSSLNKITQVSDAAAAYENTTLANMKIAESLMNKGAGTSAGSVVNRWLQGGKKATGDADVAAFNAAMVTVANEYAKVMSGALGNQALSDSARHEAEGLVNSFDSPEAIRKKFHEVLAPDMENKKKSYAQQIHDIRSRISGGAKPQSKSGGSEPPEGIDPEDWKYLSADEQAKFLGQ